MFGKSSDERRVKTRRRTADAIRSVDAEKTMNNCSSRGFVSRLPLSVPRFSLCFYLLVPRDRHGRVRARDKKKADATAHYEGNGRAGGLERARSAGGRVVNTAAKNAISCQECQTGSRSSGRSKPVRQSSRIVYRRWRVFQYATSIAE